jgi:hypothetical protein|tara:strand:- start:1004 stop:1150 length:147 start_codon:yes stop_codon:yes gene_type:complete
MRRYYSDGTQLTKAQKTLPEALQKIIKAKTKKKTKKPSMMVKAIKGKK